MTAQAGRLPAPVVDLDTLAVPDPTRWPGLADVPPSGTKARAVAGVLRSAARRVGVRVDLPGRSIGSGPTMTLRRPEEFFARVGRDGLIGFGESWMTGAWTASDLAGVLSRFAGDLPRLVPRPLQAARRWYVSRQPTAETNTTVGARDNIARHYDLSNDLFQAFLDESLSYSSALFAPGDDLHAAQLRKTDAILDAAGVTAGSRVLEIGSGWGTLAIRAAQRGAEVVTLTLSVEQQALANERIRAAGVADHVQVLLSDYREVHGEYDAVVSVEMIEAVSEEYWPTYFQAIDSLLAPGGRAAIQAILMDDERVRTTRNTYTWMHKYIFPGGLIPSLTAIDRALETTDGLEVVHKREFGLHYAETLRRWRQAFLDKAEDVLRLGFDPTFLRMWEFYLAYSEAGFRARYIGVAQLTLARGGPA